MAKLHSDIFCVIQALRYDDRLVEAREYVDYTMLSTCKSVIAIGVKTGVVLSFSVEHNTKAGEDFVRNEKKLVLLFKTSVGWVDSDDIKSQSRFYISKLDSPLGVTESGKLLFLTLAVHTAMEDNFITAVGVKYRFNSQIGEIHGTANYFLPCPVHILDCISKLTSIQATAAQRRKVLKLDMAPTEFAHMVCMQFLRIEPSVYEEMPVGFLFLATGGSFFYDFGQNCLSPNISAEFCMCKRGMTSGSLISVSYLYLFVPDIILRSEISKTYHIRLGSELNRIDVIEPKGVQVSVNLYDSKEFLAADCDARSDPHYNLKSLNRK